MAAKAILYAENQLGVHEVHERVSRLLVDLDVLLADLDKAQDRKRDLNERFSDREVELIDEMRSVHVSYSDTRFNSEMKLWRRKDKDLMRIQVEINTALSEIQGREYDLDIIKLRIRAGCSRMEELGGYLHYLAAVKEGETAQTQADNSNKKDTTTT